jgi:hypothetical protein
MHYRVRTARTQAYSDFAITQVIDAASSLSHRKRRVSTKAFPQKLSVSAAHVGGHADLTVTNIHRPFMQKRAK